jgi:signal transduction histidine kinase
VIAETLVAGLPAQSLFLTSPLPMWVVEATTLRIVASNEAACSAYGYSSDDFSVVTFTSLAAEPRDRTVVHARTTSLHFQGRQTHRTRSGVAIEVELTTEDLAQASSPHLLVIARNLTEQMTKDETLSFQKSVLAAQSEASPDAILVIDPAGKIVSFNQRFVEMWRIPADIVASRCDDEALASVVNALSDPAAFLGKVRYLYDHPDETSRDDVHLKDGRILDRHSSPLRGQHGEPFGRIWFFRDITADRTADEHLRKCERLSLLGSLASGVAHEINNPLAYLISNNEMVRDDLHAFGDDAELSEQVRAGFAELAELMARSHAGLLQIKNVVESLRTLSRPTKTSEPVDVLPMARSAITLAAERAREKNVTLATDLAAVSAVPARGPEVAQVLLNLVFNAIDASEVGATVRVSALETAEFVEFSVHDSGAGIPSELQPRVFEPFFTTKHQGTGLGLTISQRIAHDHGGTLTFTSTPRAGTTFYFRLPKRDAP